MADVSTVKRMRREARRRRQVVGVLGSGETADECAVEVGRLIAALGCDLLTGGGGGAMAAACRAFAQTPGRVGISIGIIPGSVERMVELERRADSGAESISYDVDERYPNEWIDLPIYTHLPDSGPAGTLRTSRNHINVLTADALVALPGGEGTFSEMWLALRYGVPLIAYGPHARVPGGVTTTRVLEEVEKFLKLR
jgi:predicted Rossmann-fold nucleotide-binding protein